MKVEILKPCKSVTQSGAGEDVWVVRFIKNNNERHLDPLMGWCNVSNTNSQVKLEFNSLKGAIAYAQENGLEFRVIEPKVSSVKRKSYVQNFTS
jgi:hypothetical protein